MDLDKRIKLFFYNSRFSKKEYAEFYKRLAKDKYNKEKKIRYSPLFILRKDIEFLLKEIRGVTPLSTIILLHILLEGIISRAYNPPGVKNDRKWDEYMKKYVHNVRLKPFKILRNALTHNFYYLFYTNRNKNKDEKIFFNIGSYSKAIQKDRLWKRSYPSKRYLVDPKKLYIEIRKSLTLLNVDLMNKSNKDLRGQFSRKIRLKHWILEQ